VAHKSGPFHFVAYVYTTRTENFYNMSTVPKTLVKMLTLCCKSWSQSYPVVQSIKSVRCKHDITNDVTWTVLQRIVIIYCLWILYLASTFYMKTLVNRLHGGPLFSAPLCICKYYA